jgi:uncharacterized membrane-anchored protein
MADKSIIITAKAQGLILSHIAAGTKMRKNSNLLKKDTAGSILPASKANTLDENNIIKITDTNNLNIFISLVI